MRQAHDMKSEAVCLGEYLNKSVIGKTPMPGGKRLFSHSRRRRPSGADFVGAALSSITFAALISIGDVVVECISLRASLPSSIGFAAGIMLVGVSSSLAVMHDYFLNIDGRSALSFSRLFRSFRLAGANLGRLVTRSVATGHSGFSYSTSS